MYIRFYLLPFALAYAAATELPRRGLSFRPGRVETDPVEPAPVYHAPASDYIAAGNPPRLGRLPDEGSEPVPEYQPASKPNECLRETCSELTQEVAKQMFEQMVQALVDSPSSSTTSQRLFDGGFATQVLPPTITASVTRSPIANLEVAKTMSLAQEELALFDQEEQEMYLDDRICFYANVKRKYAAVASAAPTPSDRLRRNDILGAVESAETATPTPLASSDVPDYQSALWNSQMPYNLLSIYAPATANGSLTTATTTCSGLGGAPSITMSFVQARISSHTPTPTPTSNMVANVATTQAKAGCGPVVAVAVALLALVAA